MVDFLCLGWRMSLSSRIRTAAAAAAAADAALARGRIVAVIVVGVVSLPLHAKVIDQSDLGFSVAHVARVAATPEDVWNMLRSPRDWWSKDHSWSGDAQNFWLDSQAGGCFCESLPGAQANKPGSIQHARIIFAQPWSLLRLSGAFGPLQGEALNATLTIRIAANATGSAIRFDYVVGGYMRFKVAEISPVVDGVIGEQLGALAEALGGALPPPAATSESTSESKPPPGAPEEEQADGPVAEIEEVEEKLATGAIGSEEAGGEDR